MPALSQPAVTLRALRIGEPVRHQALAMYPLFLAPDAPARRVDYVTLRDALDAGTARITEISAHGSVPELAVVNDGPLPLLLLDGEELVGAKQNRILNLTILVPAQSRVAIPVSCVEAGRWHARSAAFAEAKHAMHASARAGKTRRVTQSMREGRGADADQMAVWADVDMLASSLGAVSSTRAMKDVFDRYDGTLESTERAFAAQTGQVGAVFAIDGAMGVDLFDAPESFATYLPKLVRSWAMDAMSRAARSRRGASSSNDADAAQLLNAVAHASVTRHRAVGLGEDLRLAADRLSGGALEHEDVVVHLTAFRMDDGGDDDRRGHRRPPVRDNRALLDRLASEGLVRARIEDDLPPLRRPRGSERLRDRVEGMLLGLAIGDALGNTSEARRPHVRRAEHGEIRDYLPNRHAAGARVGVPSDDTQMAFWTLEHLLEHDGLEPEALARTFASRNIFGIGRTVRDFVHEMRSGTHWTRAGQLSAGNGALMRIAPVVVPHLASRGSARAVWADAILAGKITHDDPASHGACAAFVGMLWELLSMRRPPEPTWWVDAYVRVARRVEGQSRYESREGARPFAGPLWALVDTRVREAVERGTSSLEACESWYSGAFLLETVPSALVILARHGHDPEEAIVRAVNDTWDNDTVAAIVGAAVGALHGASALPPRWREGLLGRTAEGDDGRVFALAGAAVERWCTEEDDDYVIRSEVVY